MTDAAITAAQHVASMRPSNYNTSTHRPLTQAEQAFVAKAIAGYFVVYYKDDGTPFAVGARKTGLSFGDLQESVREVGNPLDREESFYFLKALR
jgi:hypothetical protein